MQAVSHNVIGLQSQFRVIFSYARLGPLVVAAVVAIQVSDPPFLFVIVTTAPSISGSPPGGPRLWCSFVLGMGEFQFYSDASEYFTGVRNLDLVRELNPELQPLDTWLTQHKNEIPLD